MERDQADLTAALFSESQGRMLISVGREDDVKFVGLCEARNIPVLRIGVTDNTGELVIQEVASWSMKDLESSNSATIPELFG
jgi:phosphoribosylformylglycinamidine synthase